MLFNGLKTNVFWGARKRGNFSYGALTLNCACAGRVLFEKENGNVFAENIFGNGKIDFELKDVEGDFVYIFNNAFPGTG